jgi:hypothetical protein
MYSFSDNKKQLDVQAFLRRAIDSSTPNRPPVEGDSRWDSRANRTFPLILAPWVDGEARPDEAVTALTKNLSGQGMTAIIAAPLEAEQLVIGFALEGQSYYLLGKVRHRTPLGGGFWQLGIELTHMITPAEEPAIEEIQPMTEALLSC